MLIVDERPFEDRSVGDLITLLGHPDARVRMEAASALGKHGSSPLLSPAVLGEVKGALAATHPERAEAALSLLLGARGPSSAVEAVDPLTAVLSDPDARVRACAAHALGKIGSRARRAVPSLCDLLADATPEVRLMAAHALGLIGDPAAGAALVPLLEDPFPEVVARTLHAIGRLGRGDQVLARRVVAFLQQETVEFQEKAAMVLGKVGEAGDPTILAALTRALASAHVGVRAAAAVALGELRAVACLPHLEAALKDHHIGARSSAAYAIGLLGHEGASAVPALVAALGDVAWSVRRDVVRALAEVGGAQAARALVAHADTDPRVHSVVEVARQKLVAEPDALA